MAKLSLQISGMTCNHCVAAVSRALDKVEGVRGKAVQIGSAEVDYDPAKATPQVIIHAVEEQGYTAQARS